MTLGITIFGAAAQIWSNKVLPCNPDSPVNKLTV